MERAEILEQARKCVCGDREQDYGSPEDSFLLIGQLWEPYINKSCLTGGVVNLSPHDVAVLLALLKIARIGSGHGKNDNWVDLAGYAACGGELEANGK